MDQEQTYIALEPVVLTTKKRLALAAAATLVAMGIGYAIRSKVEPLLASEGEIVNLSV